MQWQGNETAGKDLPKAIILGLSFVTVVYLLINFVFLKTLPIDHLAGNLNAASEASDVILEESVESWSLLGS